MDQSFRSLVVGALLFGTLPSAFASSSATLTVSGTIQAGACKPVLSSSRIDLGNIFTRDLDAEKHTELPKHNLMLRVECSQPTVYAIMGNDTQAGTAYIIPGRPSPYGFGLTPAGEKIGAYYLRVQPLTSSIDGRPAFLTQSTIPIGWLGSNINVREISNSGFLLGMVDRAGSFAGPSPAENATFDIEVSSFIAPTNGLTLTGGVTLDGQATLMLKYL